MKRNLRRMASFCMTVVLLLSSVVWAPAASAEGETISLEEAEIQITEVCYYNGSPQTPEMTVTLHTKVLTKGLDYTTTYQDNVDAGTATVTVKGEGIYSGSASALFLIHPRKVDEEDFSFDVNSCSKNYDGTTEAFPEIELKVMTGDTVEVSYQKAEYESQYVDDGLLITVSGIVLTGEDGKNYSLREQNVTRSSNRGEIRPLAIQFENNKKLAMGCSLDLRELISNGWDRPVRFEWDSGGAQKGCSIEDSSILKAGEEKGRITIYASTSSYNVDGVGDAEYLSSSYQPLKIEIVDQEEQAPLSLVAEGQPSSAQVGTATVYYGQTLDFDAQGGSGTGSISFHLQEEYGLGGAGTMDPSTGSFTATEVGKVIVTAQRAGDDRYKDITSNAIVVTILPAPLTIQVKDKTARIGDAIPTLTAADYTVTGLVGSDTLAQAPSLTYASTPDMSKTGAVAIQASGAAIPNGNYDPNIMYLPGVLTIQEIPTYTVTVTTAENGTITADKATAQEGDTITLTVRPAEEYRLEALTVTTDAAAPGTVAVKDMGEGVYTFTMPAGNVVVSGTMVPEEATPEWPPFPFTDVPEHLWYYDSVYYVYAYGLMNGTAATLFSPGSPTTRGMLVTILYRMEGSPQGSGWGPFTDVNLNQYYAQPIAWAAWNGIVNGITSTTFAPEQNVTREQMAAILYRYADWKGWDVSQQGNLFQFADWQEVKTYARTPLAWAVAAGLIQGKENQRLDPGGPATRAEVATILQRFHSTYVAPPAEEETA